MSRIENILEKAEREGTVRRSLATISPLDASVQPTAMMMETIGSTAAAPVATALPMRVVDRTNLDPRLITAISSSGLAGEQYRALRTRILHSDNGSAVNVVLVTSPGRGEGKTITTANLGLTMAQEYQRRICVMDADMRHPQLHRMFGIPQGPGLSDVLSGDAPLEDALITIEEQQITLLPAGRPPARPAELLGTTAMRRTLEALRSQFDRVVIDAPATMPLADVGILTPLVDSVVLVVRAASTSKPAIHDAVASIDGTKLLGIVLNEAAA
jgi:capsular exopolysaccharide synthesis family protein